LRVARLLYDGLVNGTNWVDIRLEQVPIYFFHLHEAESVIYDGEGTTLPDDAAARGAGVRAARDVLAGAVLDGRLPVDHFVVITDHAGRVVLSLTLGASVGFFPKE
jgi:hypothetical protein